MRRFTTRDVTLYLLIVLALMFAFSSLQQLEAQTAPTYSEIRTCFLQQKVKSFTLVDHTLTLTLRGEEGKEDSTMTYQIADPSLFYDNMLVGGLTMGAAAALLPLKIPASLFNAAVAIAAAPPLCLALRYALRRAHVKLA